MRITTRKGTTIIAAVLCVLLTISAWAFTPSPTIKPTPKPTYKQTSKPSPTPKPSSMQIAADETLSTERAKSASIQLVTEPVTFYIIDKNSSQKIQKSFYWVSLPSGLRRFDAKLPPTAFRKNSMGKWVVSTMIVDLTKNMARKLYNSEDVRVTCYFGQYYAQIVRNETRMTPGIHEGIDFASSTKNAVFYSLTTGTVVKVVTSDNSDVYAYCTIRTDDGNLVNYIHGSSYFVKEGERVKVGTKLGRQGDRGAKGAYHVHVSVEKPNAIDFSRSRDPELTNDVPYEFWAKWIKQ